MQLHLLSVAHEVTAITFCLICHIYAFAALWFLLFVADTFFRYWFPLLLLPQARFASLSGAKLALSYGSTTAGTARLCVQPAVAPFPRSPC